MSTRLTRRYDGSQREQAAEATRARVRDAAQALFTRKGIDQVTVAQIADQAGVATSTVYALYKSKDGILQAILRAALFGERFQAAQQVMQGVEDAAIMVALTAQVARAIYESEHAELGLLRGASAFSPSLRKIEAQFEQQRYDMQEGRLRLLFSQGKARAGLDLDKARRILWMYTSRDTYRMLVSEGGWSPDDYQAWLADTLLHALVAPQAAKATKTAIHHGG